jgi:hypothetical protein
MSMNRWKVLACTLTVGVGGLAVFATDPLPAKVEPVKEPAPLPGLTVKPASPANGTDTPPPVIPVKADEFELSVPAIPATPPKPEADAKKPTSEPVFEPVSPPEVPIILPVKGEADGKDKSKPDTKKPEADKALPTIVLPEAKKPEGDKVPVITLPEVKKPETKESPKLVAPPVPEVSKPVDAPKAPGNLDVPVIKVPLPDSVPNNDPVPLPPKPVVLTPNVSPATKTPEVLRPPVATTPIKSEQAKLKMLLRMGDGKPRFEIRNTATTELLLKVYGEKIEMQSPPDAKGTLAGVSATGAVRFSAPGIEGTCDHLRIMSATGELLLEGQIRVKTKHGKVSTEMTADKMVFQISTSGIGAGNARIGVTPAGYIPD